jgi:hypothetical protein
MTTRIRLISNSELDRVLAKLREHGVQIGAVDIRTDGVTVYAPTDLVPGNDYDRWKAQNENHGGPAHR